MKKKAASKTKLRRCRKPRCRNYLALTSHGPNCARCTIREWREKNPIPYAFKNLKSRAKQRGKEFTLTIEEFTHFCVSTGILDGRGKFKGELHIDRRCSLRGYHAWNIQPLECGENNRKKFAPYQFPEPDGNPF